MAGKKPKYYAIKVGRSTGIVRTWAECERAVKGYPGAVFKSFLSEQEAIDWLEGRETADFDTSAGKHSSHAMLDSAGSDQQETVETYDYDVYTDGSYANGQYAWAYVFVKDGEVVFEDYDVGKNSDAAFMRNVAGEIAAVLHAVKKAASMNARIRIHHDYAGIAHWVTGEWEAKNQFTKLYKRLMQQHKGIFTFQKVQAHSDNKFNDYVDRKAKEALGITS